MTACTIVAVLDQRERLIAKLAIMAGIRPGEIFALTWGRLTTTYVDIRQRVYRGTIDTPKTGITNIVLAHSEEYCPPKSDALIDVVREYFFDS